MIALPLGAIVWSSFFFLLFSLLACCFAVAVLLSNNIVRMAFYLVISLFSTAGLFFLAGAEFVGAMQIMIYVGGTLVLLIFGVMLTAQESFIRMKSGGGEWLLTLIIGASMLGLLVQTAFSVKSWNHAPEAVAVANPQETAQIGMALLGNRVDKESQPNAVKRNGMSSYLLPFEIVSVHLLVVLVGAAYLARPKRRVAGMAPAKPAQPAVGSASGPKHHPLVLLVLYVGIIKLLIGGAACFIFGDQIKAQLPMLAGAANWLMPTLGIVMLLQMLMLVVILQWQKWGFGGLVTLAIAQAMLVFVAGAGVVPAVGLLVAIGIGLAVLYCVMQIGGARGTWARLR